MTVNRFQSGKHQTLTIHFKEDIWISPKPPTSYYLLLFSIALWQSLHVCSFRRRAKWFGCHRNACVNCERKIDGWNALNERHDTHCNVYYYCLTEGKLWTQLKCIRRKENRICNTASLFIQIYIRKRVWLDRKLREWERSNKKLLNVRLAYNETWRRARQTLAEARGKIYWMTKPYMDRIMTMIRCDPIRVHSNQRILNKIDADEIDIWTDRKICFVRFITVILWSFRLSWIKQLTMDQEGFARSYLASGFWFTTNNLWLYVFGFQSNQLIMA